MSLKTGQQGNVGQIVCVQNFSQMLSFWRMTKAKPTRRETIADSPKEAALTTLSRLLDPLVDLVLDAGVTVQEFSRLLRIQAVHAAAKRVLTEDHRTSRSRIAILTGLSRSEVARILGSSRAPEIKRASEHPARRVLAGWFDDVRFLQANGDPEVLPVFGKRRSFEQLVSKHSAGIPVRAMLDELIRIGAVEMLPDQRVKPKVRIPVLSGLTSGSISSIGERARDLLETLIYNMSGPARPRFEATAVADNIDMEWVPLIRKEISEQGVSFINGSNSLFARFPAKPRKATGATTNSRRLGVTVFYFEESKEEDSMHSINKPRPRRNLRRSLTKARNRI